MQKVKKHPKLDDNFDIQRQLEHFKYEMNQTLITKYYPSDLLPKLRLLGKPK